MRQNLSFLISFLFLAHFYCTAQSSVKNILEQNNCSLEAKICIYDISRYNKLINTYPVELHFDQADTELVLPNAVWNVYMNTSSVPNNPDALNIDVTFHLLKGNVTQSSVSVDLKFNHWDRENYVLMPAAVYNGNRFDSRRIAYSPKLLDPKDIGPDKPIIISDVPRLNINDGPSLIQERSGSMSVPSVGFQSPSTQKGFFMLTKQGNSLGDYGFNIEETCNYSTGIITLMSPIVRERYKYHITDNMFASNDKPANFNEGDKVTLSFRLYFFDAPTIQSLFDYFASIRHDLVFPVIAPTIPYSSCFDVIEKKFNKQNFVPEWGYYAVGMRENFLQDWQIGWTGGMITTYPLLFAGNKESRQNVIRNFDWLFSDGISPSGYFWDSGEKGNQWYGGDIRKPHTVNWHLIRKSGDGLYYIIKQFLLMEKQGIEIKDSWKSGVQRVADTFVKTWKKCGQFGQFVDSRTGDVVVGGSTSAAIVPAALTLAHQYFGQQEYLDVAIASANYMYDHYISKGVSCGGPGDAMQNPDQESSYGMLESFMLLYEVTHQQQWLQYAREMAAQCCSWVMGYDYSFPESSLFGQLGMHSSGSVFANTQNKHGAPGICTYSGIAFWRLYRATSDEWYLNLLQETAYNLPQYLSTPERPIPGMKIGWMSERVNTTDWLEGIGEIFAGSTWSETALMLTYIEIPGVYIHTDKSKVWAFDNVRTTIISNNSKRISVQINNPTAATAHVKVYSEHTRNFKNSLGHNALWGCQQVILKPGESKVVSFNK